MSASPGGHHHQRRGDRHDGDASSRSLEARVCDGRAVIPPGHGRTCPGPPTCSWWHGSGPQRCSLAAHLCPRFSPLRGRQWCWARAPLLRCDLTLTNATCKDPMSKSGHIRRCGGLGVRYRSFGETEFNLYSPSSLQNGIVSTLKMVPTYSCRMPEGAETELTLLLAISILDAQFPSSHFLHDSSMIGVCTHARASLHKHTHMCTCSHTHTHTPTHMRPREG